MGLHRYRYFCRPSSSLPPTHGYSATGAILHIHRFQFEPIPFQRRHQRPGAVAEWVVAFGIGAGSPL